jgi:hypothetical protein
MCDGFHAQITAGLNLKTLTLGFSSAARTHASYVAGNTMEKTLSPRPLQAIVGFGLRRNRVM